LHSNLAAAFGSESVKVTSLGKAQWTSSYTDHYGRGWQIFAWDEPWADTVLIATSLPTPQGYVAFLVPIATGFRALAVETQKLLLDYVYVALGGTLRQWQDFLAQKNAAPKALSAFKLRIDPEHAVQYRSQRCELQVSSDMVPISRDSMLWLNFNFFRDCEAVVWDVSGITLAQSAQKHNWVEAWRNSQPEATLAESFQSHWNKLQACDFPFNGTITTANGATRISSPAGRRRGCRKVSLRPHCGGRGRSAAGSHERETGAAAALVQGAGAERALRQRSTAGSGRHPVGTGKRYYCRAPMLVRRCTSIIKNE
jgi:hypothetical protein